MPRARCTRGLVCKTCTENAHEHTGSAEAIRHSLRNGFTAYAALSPATNSSCHRRQRIDGSSTPGWADLPPRTWGQQQASGPHGFAVRDPVFAKRLRRAWYPSDEILAKAETAPFVLRALLAHGNRPANRLRADAVAST